MSRLPIPPAVLKPAADALLKLAADRLGKGNPLVGVALNSVRQLIDDHGAKAPPELAPVKRQISAKLASDFAAMDAAFDRAQKAGQWKPPS